VADQNPFHSPSFVAADLNPPVLRERLLAFLADLGAEGGRVPVPSVIELHSDRVVVSEYMRDDKGHYYSTDDVEAARRRRVVPIVD
jgi:hypothetical protein